MKTYTPLGILLAAVTFLLFGRTMGYDFVWDDIGAHLVENPYLNPPTWENVARFWTETYKRLYIPVSYSLWGLLKTVALRMQLNEASVYHFVNICLHSYNGILVMVLLGRFTRNKWGAFCGALGFIVHPVQVESVAWISEFRGLVAAAFGFTALWFYLETCRIRICTPGKNAGYLYTGAGWLCFVLAVLSKPSAVVFILFAGVLAGYQYRLTPGKITGGLWYWLIPVFVVTLITTSVHERDLVVPVYQRPLIWMDAVSFYIYKLLFPFSLAASYARTPTYVFSNGWVYISWVVPALLASLCVLKGKRFPFLPISGLLFLIGFLPVSGLVVFHFQNWSTVADRYMYLSMFGVSLFLAGLVSGMSKNRGSVFITGLIILWAGQSALVQAPVWKNNYSLWTHCINVTPLEYISYFNRGTLHQGNGEFKKAVRDYTDAVKVNPLYAPAYNNRGTAYKSIGEVDRAVADFKRAIQLNAQHLEAYINLGSISYENGKMEQALLYYDKAIQIQPDCALAYENRAITYCNLKRYKDAASDINLALGMGLKIDPGIVSFVREKINDITNND